MGIVRGTNAGATAALVCIALAAGTVGAQQARGHGLIVDAAWVADALGSADLVVLQVGPPAQFAAEHIRGAQDVAIGDLAVDDGIALELPPLDDLRTRLAALGVGDDTRIVVVHAGGWLTPSARVVFTLDYAGLGPQTRVLDGGLEAWKAAGYPVTSEVTPPVPAKLTRPSADRVVSHEWVQANARRAGVRLFDARAAAFYDGVRDDRGATGHIPGARSFPWQELVREEGDIVWFRSDEEIRQVYESHGAEPGDLVVGYCHVGQYATMLLLGARAAGYDVRLFDGSMDQWRKLGLPLTTDVP